MSSFIIVGCGLPGTGKTTACLKVQQYLNDAEFYNPDRARNELLQMGLINDVYSRADGIKVKEYINDKISGFLENGMPYVLVEGGYKNRKQRDKIIQVAAIYRASLLFLHTTCSEQTAKERITNRKQDIYSTEMPGFNDTGIYDLFKKSRKNAPFDHHDIPENISVVRLSTETYEDRDPSESDYQVVRFDKTDPAISWVSHDELGGLDVLDLPDSIKSHHIGFIKSLDSLLFYGRNGAI